MRLEFNQCHFLQKQWDKVWSKRSWLEMGEKQKANSALKTNDQPVQRAQRSTLALETEINKMVRSVPHRTLVNMVSV